MSKLLFVIFFILSNGLSADNINFQYPCDYEVKYGLEDGKIFRDDKTCIITVVYTFDNKEKIKTAKLIDKENCSNFDNIEIIPNNITKVKWTTIDKDVDSVANLMIVLNENKYLFGNKAISRQEFLEKEKAKKTIKCKAKISQKSCSQFLYTRNVLTENIEDKGYNLKIIE